MTVLLTALVLFPVLTSAQDAPPGTIGRVDGTDISVDSGAPAGQDAAAAASIYVLNGSVVTVHSGTAVLALVAGGLLDICGPAKFTLLQSGSSITLALNFGRMRIELPAATALRIFTPTIIATPLDIGGEARDVTVGLDLNDTFCVLATSGAMRVEHQFTGERLVVPQAGEFSLANGKLVPVAGSPGSCQCGAMQSSSTPAQPEPTAGLSAPAITAQHPTPSAEEPAVEYSIPARANETHPLIPPRRDSDPEPPPDTQPVYKVVMPALTFSAGSPSPPPDVGEDMFLLVRVAHVEPDWTFTGHVEAPRLENVNQSSSTPHAQTHAPPKPGNTGGGFWSRLKRFFVGG